MPSSTASEHQADRVADLCAAGRRSFTRDHGGYDLRVAAERDALCSLAELGMAQAANAQPWRWHALSW
eukprot:3302251-Alexandrium_andersonii.AAC.1